MRDQSYIYRLNHWLLEPDLGAILGWRWPGMVEVEEQFRQVGELAGGAAYEVADHIDHDAPPKLIMHDLDGNRVDRARLCPAHRDLLKELASINRPPYQGGSWHHHFGLLFLLADPGLSCTLVVTNQTVYAIHKYAPDLKKWVDPLLSGECWGATWMTEIQGGSDLGANTTTARKVGEGWVLQGLEKYFASNAGLADLAVVTARPEGAVQGPKGIGLFIVPRTLEEGGLNFLVRRFKEKSATRAVPTGEVELRDSQAYLVGEAEKGIYYTLETLTVSRLANAVGAMGMARKAHLESLFRAERRSAFGSPIIEHPLLKRDLTDMAVRTSGGLSLLFHAVDAFDRAWGQQPPYGPEYHYARFLSHLAKNRTADHSAAVTLLGMELFGGLGFLEEYPIARLHREALITPIWEGTSNIQALDLLEAMAKKGAHEPFMEDMFSRLEGIQEEESRAAKGALAAELDRLSGLSGEGAQWYAKEALQRMADSAQVALLYGLAEVAGERYAKLARLYARRFVMGEGYPAWVMEEPEVWLPEEVREAF